MKLDDDVEKMFWREVYLQTFVSHNIEVEISRADVADTAVVFYRRRLKDNKNGEE